MRWKTTWLLVALAGALFAFIWLVERRWRPTSEDGEPPPRLVAIKPAEITSVQVHRTNQFVLRAERVGSTWNLTAPLSYPAQSFALSSLLRAIDELAGYARITSEDLAAHRRNVADYGLSSPQAVLTLQQGGERIEVLFGHKTPVGDQVYVQLLASPSIYVVPAELFDRLPRRFNDWRETALIVLGDPAPDRFEVRSAARGYAVQVDSTNNLFLLTKPTPARADRGRVEAVLRSVLGARVVEFVTDDPKAEPELYGLQPPEAEIVFGQGTNDLVVVQFGHSPTNDPTLVYARRLAQTNIVLTPRAVLDAALTPFSELRDRRLLTFDLPAVTRIDVAADEKFALTRQTNGSWQVDPPQAQAMDSVAVREFLEAFVRLEGGVEKDVVTDYAAYQLAPPLRQYTLQGSATNANGTVTNRILAQLNLGARREDKVFARRADEATVYTVTPGDFELLPTVAWQFRDRRVWSFTTNQIARISIRDRGYARELTRTGPASWKLAPGSQGILSEPNELAVEEMMFRVGELRALYWVDRGAARKAGYGFADEGYRLTIDLKGGGEPDSLVLEFAARSEGQLPLAAATVGGESWILKFPPKLYFEMIRDLGNPARR